MHYEKVSEIHVSGHASQEELKTCFSSPGRAISCPSTANIATWCAIAGSPRKSAYRPRIALFSKTATCWELTAQGAQKTTPIQVGKVFVDGKGVGDVGDIVIRDRRHLSEDGMVLAVMAIHQQQSGDLVAGPDMISRGFMRAEESEEVLEHAKKVVLETLNGMNRETRTDPAELKEEVRRAAALF